MDNVHVDFTQNSTLHDQIVAIEQSHHAFTRDELELISNEIVKLASEGVTVPAGLTACFRELQEDLIPHLLKEERILFPYITALESNPANPPHSCFGNLENPIHAMQLEHHQVKELLYKMRSMTADYKSPLNGRLAVFYTELKKLDGDLQAHIHWEDDILFPSALALAECSTRS